DLGHLRRHLFLDLHLLADAHLHGRSRRHLRQDAGKRSRRRGCEGCEGKGEGVSEAAPRPAFAPGSHPIAAHGQGAFAFAGMRHEGSILATPKGVRPLAATSVEALDTITLAPLLSECAESPGSIEFLVVGTGE